MQDAPEGRRSRVLQRLATRLLDMTSRYFAVLISVTVQCLYWWQNYFRRLLQTRPGAIQETYGGDAQSNLRIIPLVRGADQGWLAGIAVHFDRNMWQYLKWRNGSANSDKEYRELPNRPELTGSDCVHLRILKPINTTYPLHCAFSAGTAKVPKKRGWCSRRESTMQRVRCVYWLWDTPMSAIGAS